VSGLKVVKEMRYALISLHSHLIGLVERETCTGEATDEK